jgi:hypothetical protein
MDERKVRGNLVRSWWLEEDVRIVTIGDLIVRVRSLRKRCGRDDSSCERCRSIEVLQECPAKRDHRSRCIDRNSREEWEMFATVSVSP